MIYCIWSPLIIPISEIPPCTILNSHNALYPNYFRVFFMLLQEFKYQPEYFSQGIRYCRGEESLGAALVTESCVVSQLVCHSPDSSTLSEII